ncbi:MAG: Ig-like domain-containing protein [Gemmatimonadota bacterium]
MRPVVTALLLLSCFPLQATAQSLSSRIDRIVIHPADRTMIAGDTLRLRGEAYDASGALIPGVQFRFAPAGAVFEASVDPSGLITSGATGTVPVGVAAILPGAAPLVQRIDIEMVPGPVASVEITPRGARLVAGQRMKLGATAHSALGDVRDDGFVWRSSAPEVASVDELGRVRAVAAGEATISATTGGVSSGVAIEVVPDRVARVEITPSATRARQGDVIRFEVTAIDEAGRPIEGLAPTYTFAPGDGVIGADGAFVGYRTGEYVVSASFGSSSADALVELESRDVRRPVEVVGRLPRTTFTTEEVWPHPTEDVVYLGTGSGGDRMYVIDVSDPANPVVTDSLVADTRRVNDVMTTPDGQVLVHTREGASNRRNGIVIASLADPRHPEPIAEFTDGVTAGVHSAFVYHQQAYGTHVYLTNNGTNAMHVIDISDPYNPREVSQWRSPSPDAGGSLHDIDVQDGLAYLSNWNDGLIVLDVGNGVREGSPSNPQLVSQYKYDLNELYEHVAADGGPGFIRGTHTAWRHNDYVFIADEVFPSAPQRGTRDASATRAYGTLQVIDVSDWENPRSVAWYTPEDGGVHNIWIEDDLLYMGAYTSGFRIFDVSGELRGDLRAQAREIAHLNTADMQGHVQNQAMTWGVVVKDGLAYVNDMHNGLWIVRLQPDAGAN